MQLFEWILALLFGAVLLAAAARRLGAPYPALLAVGGALLALAPGGPQLALDPDLALALFVAPVLLDAAYDTSVRDLRANWRPVLGFVLGAVCATTAAVAWVAHALVPALPWAAAVALGAIVAPPDAAAATAVLRQVRPPHRILVILEGESLLNDASALLIYRFAVGAAVGGGFSAAHVPVALALTLGGSLLLGWGLARLYQWLFARVTDVASSVVLQFVGTFGVWILADRLGLSAVLTVVAYGVTLARSAPLLTPARLRVPSYAVWETAVFVLNVLAFVLVGLQLRPTLDALGAERARALGVSAAVLATVLLVRPAWVLAYNAVARWDAGRDARRHTRRTDASPGLAPSARALPPPTWRGGLITSWAGMRGIVTLAAAFALPAGFPSRDLVVLVALCVVLGTLVLQGLTLRPIVERLALRDDAPVARETALAREAGLRAAVASLDAELDAERARDGAGGSERVRAVRAVRREYADALGRAEVLRDGPGQLPEAGPRRRAVAAARTAIAGLRDHGEIGDAAFHAVEEELDLVELRAGGGDVGDDGPG